MTKPTSPDWVSMVGIAQDTAAPAVITAGPTWSGEELLGHAAGAVRGRAAGGGSGAGPAGGEPRGARPGTGGRRHQAADRAARSEADRARTGRLRPAAGRALPRHPAAVRGRRRGGGRGAGPEGAGPG